MPTDIRIESQNELQPIKSGSSVYITYFENVNSIYIRDASYDIIEDFNSFNKQMLKYYRNGILNLIFIL